LEGKAGVWWSHYRTSLPANAVVTWDLFKTAFRNTYIPQGLMTIKHTKFMNLTQGTKSLTEYLHAFNNLSRYATEFVDTEAKKLASFKRGLGPELSKNMVGSKTYLWMNYVKRCFTSTEMFTVNKYFPNPTHIHCGYRELIITESYYDNLLAEIDITYL